MSPLVVALLAAGFGATAYATGNDPGLSVETPPLEEVRVIGRREVLAEAQFSSSAVTISSEDQVSLSRSVGDWIELLPGVSLNGQGGLLQAYSIRGFSRARIRTEIDGVPIFTDRRAGNSVSFVPPELLGQVVVEKAPSSSLYGSGAMGGVVSLNSADPRGFRLRLDGRSNDEQLALTALGGNRDFGGGISVRRAQDARAGNGQALNTRYEQVAALLRGRHRVGDLDVTYTWLPGVGRDIGRSNALYPLRRVSRTPRDRHSVARLEFRSNEDWLLRAYHHYQNWDTQVERVGRRSNLTTYESHTLGALFFASTEVLGGAGAWGVEWVARRGVDIRESEFSRANTRPLRQRVLDGHEDTLGLFVEQGWNLARTEIRGGLRLDRIAQSGGAQDDKDTRWSGLLRAEHAASSALTLSAELATAYRFPSLSERYFSGVTPRGEVLGNPGLVPEVRDSIEVGMTYRPPQRPLSAGLVAYHSQLEDYIERVSIDETLTTFKNRSAADITGAEAQLAFRWGRAAHRFSYQWQEGEDDTGLTLADLNPPEWRYHLSYRAGRYTLRSDFRYRPARDKPTPGETPLASAALWNLSLAREVRRRWRGELYVTNVLDETYRASADRLAPLQPGRAIGLRLTWIGN